MSAINPTKPLRLRPSVSIVPSSDPHIWEFFQGNTRRVVRIKLAEPSSIEPFLSLSGTSLYDLQSRYGDATLPKLAGFLFEKCCIEYLDTGQAIEENRRYRVLQFLGDYFPSSEVFGSFNRIRNSRIAVVGVGAVGSWVASGLAQIGVKSLILIDSDVVEKSNLNRSYYTLRDVGLPKVHQLAKNIRSLDSDIAPIYRRASIGSLDDLEKCIGEFEDDLHLVINCADTPSVDFVSSIVSDYCMARGIPHIIAGGYNLHLSLIGPTIVPGMGPCFECIQKALENERPEEFEGVRKLERKRRNIGNLSPINVISSTFVINDAVRLLCNSARLKPQMIGRRGGV